MTKTLTEQWREGTLEDGFYYVMSGWSTSIEIRYLGKGFFEGNIKVLASVPTYAEFMDLMSNLEYIDKYRELVSKTDKLEKQLEIATKALNGIRDVWANNPSQFSYIARIANRKAKAALEKMEGVK